MVRPCSEMPVFPIDALKDGGHLWCAKGIYGAAEGIYDGSVTDDGSDSSDRTPQSSSMR
jgi:hypothetical protein